jgi:hypothetical protein
VARVARRAVQRAERHRPRAVGTDEPEHRGS